MSLLTLLTNYMTIQTSEGAVKTSQGSIDRANAWVEIEQFKNIRCAIQEHIRSAIINDQFMYIGEQHHDQIFHRNRNLYEYIPIKGNQTSLRIITALNPRHALIFPLQDADHDYKIYEFLGHFEPVRHRNFDLFTIRCSRNEKQVA